MKQKFWTYEVLWPAPFPERWVTSNKRFDNVNDAAEEMTAFAVEQVCNGNKTAVRLTQVNY